MAGMPIRRARRLAAMRAAETERAGLAAQNGNAPIVPVVPLQQPPPLYPQPKGDDVLSLAPPEKLAELVTLALERAHDILSISLDPQRTDFIKLVSLQQSTLASVLATQARTDPGRFRGRQTDLVDEILAKIRAGSA